MTTLQLPLKVTNDDGRLILRDHKGIVLDTDSDSEEILATLVAYINKAGRLRSALRGVIQGKIVTPCLASGSATVHMRYDGAASGLNTPHREF